MNDLIEQQLPIETWPKEIYLQNGTEEIEPYEGMFHAEITWCEHGIDNGDVKYVREDVVADHIERLEREKVKLREALHATLEWIDAVPSDTVLPTMPGFDRDWMNGLLEAQKEKK